MGIHNSRVLNSNPGKRMLSLFFMGCVLGSAIFVLIYGVRILNPTYDAWIG